MQGVVTENNRQEYGTHYREAAAVQKPLGDPLKIEAQFAPPRPGRQEVILLGSAGQRIITAGEITCLAGLTAGLQTTQKNEYNITVLRGPSISELILSPEEIDYTGIERPSAIVALDQEGRERCSEILAKDTPVPSIQAKLFRLSEPNQTAVTIRILEGADGKDAKDCVTLGHFDLNDLPARPDLIGRIEVTFSLDKNGILTAKARDNASGKTAEMTIDYDVSNKGSGARASAA